MTASAPEAHVPHGLDVLRTYGEGFAGREAELEALDRAWGEGARVFVLHAEGGAGKTRVVAKWLTQVRDDGWRGAGRVFVHSFYSQGSDERRHASSELFFEQALEHFGHTGPRLTDPAEQGRTLARLLVEQCGLLVLDGLEPLQHPPSFDQGRLKDPAIYSLLHSLAAGRVGDSSGSGLCVVTSRQPVVELQDKTGRTVVQQPLDRLDAPAGVELLRQLDVRGPERELREAVEDARGHAYSLMLLGTYLRDATDDHEIRRRREIPLLDEDKEHRYHARHLFGAYVRHLGESSPEVAALRLLGFFDRPAEEKLLAVLREADELEMLVLTAPFRNLSEADWRRVLRRLTLLRLIDVPVSSTPPIDSHPLLREYFAEQLRTCFHEAWQAGHRRLFDYLCQTTEHRPDTIAGLQPLYQAIVHGCLAELHKQAWNEIYCERILRGAAWGGLDGFYSLRKLGAIGADLGAVACFFVTPWATLAPNLAPAVQALILREAGLRLRTLGRLSEAITPMRAALEITVREFDWKNAAICSSLLSEQKVMQGKLTEAITAGEQSVRCADRSEDAFLCMASRTTLAEALDRAGCRDKAQRLFEEAEYQQAAREPKHPRLCSLQGFRYCDLLLAEAERAAWQRWLFGETAPGELLAACMAACDAASERAQQWFEWQKPEDSILTIALRYLTLAQANLYKACSENAVRDQIETAIKRLREAAVVEFLPRGLLTRAWMRYLIGDGAGCREDLDEAWEIAERGPMPLFQADIQLTLARLFRDRAALAEARRLIEKHEYHRRDGELADAEAAAERWVLIAVSEARKEPAMSDKSKPPTNRLYFDVFLSHSNKDKPIVRELKKRLVERNLRVWLDEDEARPGVRWLELLEKGIRKSRSIAVLVGTELGPWASEEMEAALRLAVNDGRAVIPVLLPGAPDEVELPLLLANRTWANFRSGITDQELDRLVWGITSPEAGPSAGPSGDEAAPGVAGLKDKREEPNSDLIDVKWTDELRIYGEGFVGRKEELAALDRAWAEGVRIFALHAEGGAGKTRVVVEWLRRMRDDGWRGARRVFVHSFYLQGTGERSNASSEPFFAEALRYFGYRGASIDRAGEEGRMLTPLLVEHQGLLILDGLESLQQPVHVDRGRLKDPGIARLLLSLANVPHGHKRCLCLITSRQPVIELQGLTGAPVIHVSLDRLHRDDGAELLRKFQVAGEDEELQQASDELHGHAYSLMLLGSYLRNATRHRNICRRREVALLEEDIEYRSHARRMFAAYLRHLGEESPHVAALRLLGFFDRAAELKLLDVLRAREALIYEWSENDERDDKRRHEQRIEDSLDEVTAPLLDLPEPQWNRVLSKLHDLHLIRSVNVKFPAVDAHPLLREYFADQVRTSFPAAWQDGHRRLFEHFSGKTPYWPEGIDGLQPLYQAVAHGCLAGLHEQVLADVYRDRILRGHTNYSISNVEAIVAADLAALAGFFKTQWTALHPSLEHSSHGWLLSEAALRLRALGRRSEAVEPMRSAVSIALKSNDWTTAAIRSGHLSQLEFTRGEVTAAVAAGEESVKYADLGEDTFQQIYRRALLADALHQAGRHAEAMRLFDDAESRQAECQLEYPRLYSLPGFWYCDLLLSEAECAAWRRCLFTQSISSVEESREPLSCDAVLGRAQEWFDWRTPNDELLEIALEHLTLARAMFYRATFMADFVPQSVFKNINDAVDGLHAAGAVDYLPRSLLTRAWLRCLSGDELGSRSDLDEAWEIAERGPMPLFQADIQLYRARLFRNRAVLAEARRLIEKHGYHRRDEELADAEAAAKGW